MMRAARRRWFLLACTSLATGTVACGQTAGGLDGEDVGTARQTIASQQAVMNETSFAIYAANSISVGNEAVIDGGRVGVQRSGQGPTLFQGYEISIGSAAVVSTSQDVNADSLLLQAGATLGAIHANDVVDYGANHGPILPFGAMPALPILPHAFPGPTALLVPANATISVPTSARYDGVVVGDNATLRLAGGVYEMQSLTLGTKSRVETAAPTVLRIAGRLTTGEKSFIGPTANAQQVVLNARIEVEGSNGGVGGGYRLSACSSLWGEV